MAQEPTSLDLDGIIVDLISRDAVKVPPYPAVALRIEELVRTQNYGLDKLAEVIGSDPALAADTLRCANSVVYNRGSSVTSIKQAVTRIGGKEVLRLAIASGLGVHARAAGPLLPLKRKSWHQSLASALLCQIMAQRRALPAEEAFVCGLLHDFGRLVATTCIEEILLQHPEQAAMPIEHWAAVADRYHQELGLVTAARWHLPPLVEDVISLHHSDDFSKSQTPDLLEVVAASDGIVALLEEKTTVTEEDLSTVKSIRKSEERSAIARVLHTIPSFIAALEGGEVPTNPAVNKVVTSESLFESGEKPVDFVVNVVMGHDNRDYHAIGIGPTALALEGARSVPDHQLLEITAKIAPRPFNFWAAAKRCVKNGEVYRIEVRPFALGAENRARWQELVKKSWGDTPIPA